MCCCCDPKTPFPYAVVAVVVGLVIGTIKVLQVMYEAWQDFWSWVYQVRLEFTMDVWPTMSVVLWTIAWVAVAVAALYVLSRLNRRYHLVRVRVPGLAVAVIGMATIVGSVWRSVRRVKVRRPRFRVSPQGLPALPVDERLVDQFREELEYL